MPSTGLRGPFALTEAKVNEIVTKASAGAYALDSENKTETFSVCYIGRSDTDINDRLRKWVGAKYKRFKFEYYPSPKAAFEKECNLYHDWDNLDNNIHPARPAGSNWNAHAVHYSTEVFSCSRITSRSAQR